MFKTILGSLLDKINPFGKQWTKAANEGDVGKKRSFVDSLPLFLTSRFKPESEEEQFLRKLRLCINIYDLKGKDTKLRALEDILKFIQEDKPFLTDAIYLEIIKMISDNIIRTFPPKPSNWENSDAEDETLHPVWPLLETVYYIFHALLDSQGFNTDIACQMIDRKLVVSLLMLLNSPNHHERSFIKWAILRIHTKVYALRTYIRTQIYNIFYQFIYVEEDFNGISELLYIVSTVLDGDYSWCSKPEYEEYLERILMPLHKVKSLSTFHPTLMQSLFQYLLKDGNYIEPIVFSLLKFWPKSCSHKEVLFLHEIENFIIGITKLQFNVIKKPLLTQVAKCVVSPQLEVAEHAFNILNHKHMISLLKPNATSVMPILCPALMKVSKKHWHPLIVKRAFFTLQMLLEMNPQLFIDLLSNYAGEKLRVKQRQRNRELTWKKVDELVTKRRKLE